MYVNVCEMYVNKDVVLLETVILPGPIQPGAIESISNKELSYLMFKCAPEKGTIEVSEKTA